MDIVDTRDCILTWVRSCNKNEQLDLLAEVIQDYIVDRFGKVESEVAIYSAKEFLIEKIAIQKTLIKKQQPQ